MQDKNLMVIAHSYQSFIKDSVNSISGYFGQISVCVRHNPFAEISNILPINYLKPFTKKNIIDIKYKPKNVNVITTSIMYLPTRQGYLKLGESHFKSVTRQIRRNNLKNFDLIHSHFLWTSGYVGTKLKERYNIPFVVTAHGFDIYDLPFRDIEWRERICSVLDTADYIITVSNNNLKFIKELNSKTPVKVIPNGFDDNLFNRKDQKDCRRSLNLPADKKIIITVGYLTKIKGHQYLINAMSEIIKYRKDVICIIIGSGELKNNLGRQIKKEGLEKYVKLIGGRPHNEIPNWVNACDIFVLPSLNEGNPTVMFECLGCGKPFVGTKVGGIPEIIISEDYGLLANPADSKDLASKILIALNKEWNFEKIDRYAEMFTWKKIAKETMTVYKYVI